VLPVIQIVSSGLPPWLPLRSRCLADPDALLAIERTARSGTPIDALADRFSLVLHDLRVGGTWKRTNRGRLARTEEILCTHTPPGLRDPFILLDVGASDGTTTIEAVRTLQHTLGGDVRAYLADRELWLLRYRRGPIVEYRASDGEPVMIRLGPFGLRLAQPRRETRERGDALARGYLKLGRFRESMRLDARISLVNPLARHEPAITIRQFDCFARDEALAGQISAIRASNVLNLGYFRPQQINDAVGHLHSYLKDGGCLVVSRNADQADGEIENGSVWQREPHRFRHLEDFGSGSEIKSVVDGWSLD
jgi:hypothetical protein